MPSCTGGWLHLRAERQRGCAAIPGYLQPDAPRECADCPVCCPCGPQYIQARVGGRIGRRGFTQKWALVFLCGDGENQKLQCNATANTVKEARERGGGG